MRGLDSLESREVKARCAVALLQDDLVGALKQAVGHLVSGRKEVTLGQTDQCRACRRTNQGGGGGIIDQLYVLSVPMLPSSATTNFSSLLTHMTI